MIHVNLIVKLIFDLFIRYIIQSYLRIHNEFKYSTFIFHSVSYCFRIVFLQNCNYIAYFVESMYHDQWNQTPFLWNMLLRTISRWIKKKHSLGSEKFVLHFLRAQTLLELTTNYLTYLVISMAINCFNTNCIVRWQHESFR